MTECSQTDSRTQHCALCDLLCVCLRLLFDLKEGSGSENTLANALGILTCHDSMDSNTHTITLKCDTCVRVRVCVCRLSTSDRFIVEGQLCLVLSLKEPVFSPEGFN